MVVISVLGYLISNQDYAFQEAHLAYLAYNVHNAFLIFMKCILTRFTPEMFQGNYWARQLQQLVNLKTKRKIASSGGSDVLEHLNANALVLSNKKVNQNMVRLLEKCQKLKKQQPLYD